MFFTQRQSAVKSSFWNRIPFERTLLLGFVPALGVAVAVGAFTYFQRPRCIHLTDEYRHARETTAARSDLLSTLKDAETGQRGYLLTGDLRYLTFSADAMGRLPVIAINANARAACSDGRSLTPRKQELAA